MGSTTSTSSRVVLAITNSSTQTSIAKCTILCDQVLSNNTVIVAPGATAGNILFQNICIIKDASCMINQNIDTTVTNILSSTVDQAALSSQPLFSLAYNSTKSSSSLDEIITNQIQQMVSSNCTIATNQELNNNYIYVGTGATVGNISFVQHSELSNVECTMDIAAKSQSYNEGTGNVKQRATTIDITTIVIIAIIIIIVAVVIFMLIFFLRRKGGMQSLLTPPVATPVKSLVTPLPLPPTPASIPLALLARKI